MHKRHACLCIEHALLCWVVAGGAHRLAGVTSPVAALPCICRRQQNVDETVQALQAKGLQVKGVVCHVGNAQHRTQLIKQTIQASQSQCSVTASVTGSRAALETGTRFHADHPSFYVSATFRAMSRTCLYVEPVLTQMQDTQANTSAAWAYAMLCGLHCMTWLVVLHCSIVNEHCRLCMPCL